MDKDQLYLNEIRDFGVSIANFMQGIGWEQFLEDQKLQLAVLKLIENIGEASKRISEETKSQFTDVEWRKIASMRDRLVHDYMDVDLEIVFDVAENEVPDLLRKLG